MVRELLLVSTLLTKATTSGSVTTEVPNVIFYVSSSRKIFRNCTMAEDFPIFSTSKNAVPQIGWENSAILEKIQDSANSQSTFYSTQKILGFTT